MIITYEVDKEMWNQLEYRIKQKKTLKGYNTKIKIARLNLNTKSQIKQEFAWSLTSYRQPQKNLPII